MEIEKVLQKFDELYAPLSSSEVRDLNNHFGNRLPYELILLLSISNGIDFGSNTLFGYGEDWKASSIEKVYAFEQEYYNKGFILDLLPISPDGYGNHYAVRLEKSELGSVYFLQHDLNYEDFSQIELSYTSIADFIQEVFIDWTLED